MNFSKGNKIFLVIKNRRKEVIFSIEISESEFEILKFEEGIEILEI